MEPDNMDYEYDDFMTDDESKSTISSIRSPDDNPRPVVDQQNYSDIVKSITNDQYCTVDTLRRSQDEENKSVYGLIKFVAGVQSRPMVTIEDVTGTITITLPRLTTDFIIGNVVRIDSLVKKDGAFEYVYATTMFHQIQTLEYDYSSTVENAAFVSTYDREMTRLLETFQANRLFNSTLEMLPNVSSGAKSYLDLCGEVVANREMIRSIALSFWDGTIPSNEIYDPYEPEYGKDTKLNEKYADCSKNKTAHVNIWANESGLNCFHFVTARSFLSNDDDLSFVAIFNVEISKIYDETMLTMRSGLHRGKFIRKVSKNSILGKMLSDRITTNLHLIEEVSEEETRMWHSSMISSVNATRTMMKNNTLKDVTLRTHNSTHQESNIVDRRNNATTVEYADTTEEVRKLLQKLPSYLSIQTMKDMDMNSLQHFKEVIELTDNVEELKIDWSEHLTKEEFVEIVKIVIDWKRAGCLAGMIPDEII